MRTSGGGGKEGNPGGVVADSPDQHSVNGDGGTGQYSASRYREHLTVITLALAVKSIDEFFLCLTSDPT